MKYEKDLNKQKTGGKDENYKDFVKHSHIRNGYEFDCKCKNQWVG